MAKYTSEQLRQMGLIEPLPAHVGIIMDGNGRWATKRHLPRPLGHRAGVIRVKEIIRFSSDIGIRALSVYAFSTENWKRPAEEIGALCSLLIEFFKREGRELHENNVRMRVLGAENAFPEAVQEQLDEFLELTKNNTGMEFCLALNYGGQSEIIRAVRAIAADVKAGKLAPEEIDLECLDAQLYTAGLPPLDVVIRTGGEQRLSNFMLLQAAYAELIFIDDYWPDFTEKRYVEVLQEFQRRNRRYGGL
jgi:undecaprenyl diphosphate synthase